MSVTDSHAMEIHARVERLALDDVALPGKLVHQLIEWLYRENLFCQGALKIGGTFVGPESVSVPTLAVVNTADDVALLDSVKPFMEAMPANDARIIEYPGEIGVCLQHLGILIGREARAQVWPDIISLIDSHRTEATINASPASAADAPAATFDAAWPISRLGSVRDDDAKSLEFDFPPR